MKQRISLVLVALTFLLVVKPVQAIADPPLFSCTNIVGQTIANYSTGTHGVPGDSKAYQGADTVYKVDANHVLQCLCPSDSNTGIQSNWWKVSEMSQDDLDFFQRRGWIYVPNGAIWGLDAAPYLVKNDSYSCSSTGIGGGGSSSSSPTAGASGSLNTGSTLGVSNLAATGNISAIALYFGLAFAFGTLAYRFSQK